MTTPTAASAGGPARATTASASSKTTPGLQGRSGRGGVCRGGSRPAEPQGASSRPSRLANRPAAATESPDGRTQAYFSDVGCIATPQRRRVVSMEIGERSISLGSFGLERIRPLAAQCGVGVRLIRDRLSERVPADAVEHSRPLRHFGINCQTPSLLCCGMSSWRRSPHLPLPVSGPARGLRRPGGLVPSNVPILREGAARPCPPPQACLLNRFSTEPRPI